jgi:FkbM family methyltransferase
LHRNRKLNQAGFLIENCAVGNQRQVTFYLHPLYIVGGTMQRETGRPVSVPARSLAELDARYGPFTTLIIDIEGAELEVFESSLDVLRRYRLVIIELHDFAIGKKGVERCRVILTEAGFKFQRSVVNVEAWQRT